MLGILAQMGLGPWLLAVLLILVCCFLMLVILLQRGRGSGLSGAFGGGGGSSAFGAKTGDVFTWITVVVATVFVLLNVLANYAFDQTPVREQRATSEATSTETEAGGEGASVPATRIEIPPLPTGESETGGKDAEGSGTGAAQPPADVTPPDGGEATPEGTTTEPAKEGGFDTPPDSDLPSESQPGEFGRPESTPETEDREDDSTP